MAANGSLARSITELEAQEALELVKARIGRGDDLEAVLSECRQGLEEVGARFEAGEYFTADLMFAAAIFKDVMNVLGPELKKTVKAETAGKIVIATVKDDIHDVGKNLVSSMLEAAGFEVIDLGVDVAADAILENVREHSADIVALSCLLTTTVDSMEDIIAEISRSGLRDRVKVIVGGIPLSPELATAIGADAYGDNAYEAVTRCKELVGALA